MQCGAAFQRTVPGTRYQVALRDADPYRQGTEQAERAFVHATLQILDGREQGVRKQLGQLVVNAIAEMVRPGAADQTVQITANVVEMERATFAKQVIGG